MKITVRLAALLLALLLALTPLAAAEDDTTGELEQRVAQFLADYGLNEQNFSLCYYDTASGETYRFNDEKFMVAASTFKLPLNLYYYELEQSGELSQDTYVGGMRLSDAHYQSLVWSNNDVSIDMLYRLGSFRTYKDKMRKYFTMPEEHITQAYYADNNYCTSMMIDVLRYLYERQDQFPEMIGYLKEAQPGEYFDRYAGDVEVAHKYGFFYDEEKAVTAVNDVGIIYTEEPFLLAVYTANVPRGGEETVARACETLLMYQQGKIERNKQAAQEEAARRLERQQEARRQVMADEAAYTLWLEQQQEAVQAGAMEEEPALPEQDQPQQQPTEPENKPGENARRRKITVILVLAVVFLAVDLTVLLAMRRRRASRGRRL